MPGGVRLRGDHNANQRVRRHVPRNARRADLQVQWSFDLNLPLVVLRAQQGVLRDGGGSRVTKCSRYHHFMHGFEQSEQPSLHLSLRWHHDGHHRLGIQRICSVVGELRAVGTVHGQWNQHSQRRRTWQPPLDRLQDLPQGRESVHRADEHQSGKQAGSSCRRKDLRRRLHKQRRYFTYDYVRRCRRCHRCEDVRHCPPFLSLTCGCASRALSLSLSLISHPFLGVPKSIPPPTRFLL